MMVSGGGDMKDLMTHLSAIIPPMLCPTRKSGREGCFSFDIIVIIREDINEKKHFLSGIALIT